MTAGRIRLVAHGFRTNATREPAPHAGLAHDAPAKSDTGNAADSAAGQGRPETGKMPTRRESAAALFDKMRAAIEATWIARDPEAAIMTAGACMATLRTHDDALRRHHECRYIDAARDQVDFQYRMDDQSSSARIEWNLHRLELRLQLEGKAVLVYSRSFEI